MEKDKSRMVELNKLLREASLAYYQQSREIMSNYDYDALYDELVELEKKTGIILSDSVTQNVGYEVLSQLERLSMRNLCFRLIRQNQLKRFRTGSEIRRQYCHGSWMA